MSWGPTEFSESRKSEASAGFWRRMGSEASEGSIVWNRYEIGQATEYVGQVEPVGAGGPKEEAPTS
jgi:hypothetical protein